MKLTVKQLRSLVRETVETMMSTEDPVDNFVADLGPKVALEKIGAAPHEALVGWFKGNDLAVPEDMDGFRAAVKKRAEELTGR